MLLENYYKQEEKQEQCSVNLNNKNMTQRLSLFYPSKPYQIYQKFGESLACSEIRPDLPIPKRKVVGKVNGVCPVGYEELYPLLGLKGHNGQDLFAPRGTIIRSPIDGFVNEVQTEPERGLGVSVRTLEPVDMGEFGVHYAKVRQWHFMSTKVYLGQRVKVGDVLGLADSTGVSAGDHNHFELKPVDLTNDGQTESNTFFNNGFYGAIDPAPFFNGKYAIDEAYGIIFSQLVGVLNQLSILINKR